jgi:hypothetical protein
MNTDSENSPDVRRYLSGAVGAGLLLVMLPCLGLYFGMQRISEAREVGLPIVVIFGIMILFGTMALVSTLFSRLNLSDSREALALPPGSIRAAMALALVVLFAIISIMLFQSMAKPYIITGLSKSDKQAIVSNSANRVLAVATVVCPAPKAVNGEPGTTSGTQASGSTNSSATTGAASVEPCYDLHLVQPPGQEAFDLAKQLLILIGTLMTSVTSFYFATQASAAANKSTESIVALTKGGTPASAAAPSVAHPIAPTMAPPVTGGLGSPSSA